MTEGNTGAKRRKKLTVVLRMHYVKLAYRAALFLVAFIMYIQYRFTGGGALLQRVENMPIILRIIWVVFIIEMILRFFPSNLESPGCQKMFAKNYVKSGNTNIVIHDNNAVVWVLLIWIFFNSFFGLLYMNGILDDGIMVLLCCAYSVCDMICILFFCPFQSWFLKNKCCSNCRIYNWDYAMMFTPLFFVKNFYGYSLLGMAVILLIRWELCFFRHPERFSDVTNDYLRCSNCSEKLCMHKKQLNNLWRVMEQQTKSRINALRKE